MSKTKIDYGLLGVIVAIVAIIVSVTIPEIREWLGLEDSSNYAEAIPSNRTYFSNDIAFDYVDKVEECRMSPGCDCCGGEILLSKSGVAIYSMYCSPNATYSIGTYDVSENGIILYLSNRNLVNGYTEDDKPYSNVEKINPFVVVLLKSRCPEKDFIYQLEKPSTGFTAYCINAENDFNYYVNLLSDGNSYMKLLGLNNYLN